MEPQPNISIKSIGFKYGIFVAIGLIVYFIIIDVLKVHHLFGLRFISYLILAGGIALGLNEVRHRIHKHRINYLPGFGTGIWISATSSIIYALFIVLYANVINKNFVEEVRPHMPFQDYINAPMIAVWYWWEIFAFGVVFSLVMMQFFKRNRAPEAEIQEEAAEHQKYNAKSDRTTNSPI